MKPRSHVEERLYAEAPWARNDVVVVDDREGEIGIRGFADGSRYQSARPGYPFDAVAYLVERLRINAASRVLDVAAGTGLFTKELLAFTSHVVAVEPSEGMREEFARQLPSLRVVEGVAEHLAFEDGSFDALTVAQAFHWFDAEVALVEFARVLAQGGGLGLLWNERDESVSWVDELSHAILWHQQRPYDMATDFAPVVASGGFLDVERKVFKHSQMMDRASLHQRVLSTSYIAVLDESEQDRILRGVDEIIKDFDESFELPYVTTTYCARRP
jgi:SAM-dependent methyltransferase